MLRQAKSTELTTPPESHYLKKPVRFRTEYQSSSAELRNRRTVSIEKYLGVTALQVRKNEAEHSPNEFAGMETEHNSSFPYSPQLSTVCFGCQMPNQLSPPGQSARQPGACIGRCIFPKSSIQLNRQSHSTLAQLVGYYVLGAARMTLVHTIEPSASCGIDAHPYITILAYTVPLPAVKLALLNVHSPLILVPNPRLWGVFGCKGQHVEQEDQQQHDKIYSHKIIILQSVLKKIRAS